MPDLIPAAHKIYLRKCFDCAEEMIDSIFDAKVEEESSEHVAALDRHMLEAIITKHALILAHKEFLWETFAGSIEHHQGIGSCTLWDLAHALDHCCLRPEDMN
jgi:hypothetical protein